ncbi:MAG: ribonuclease III [Clostridiales bacterium]|jgi:ribonuclease-3|nr:ribonuclease III [Clostridiales bacterium]
MEIKRIEAALGYTFRDPALLRRALTHSSYANEAGEESYERLEFFGDSILSFVVTEHIFSERHGDEGDLSRLRQRVVSEPPLADAAVRLGLADALRVAKNVAVAKSMLADAFEAVTAAIFCDGGLDAARRFVWRNLQKEALHPGAATTDYKSSLQEKTQAKGEKPQYTEISRTGEEHKLRFLVEASALGKSARGEGGNLKDAEQAAAKELLALV